MSDLTRSSARLVAAACLAGMAYCHVKDLGHKLEEHVYYMGALFIANVAASVLLIGALALWSRLSPGERRAVWAASGALAAATIAGFVWSRTVGFPQMDDHVGDWDALGVTSVVLEAVVVVVSVLSLSARTAFQRALEGRPA
jgi:hypothetical protein